MNLSDLLALPTSARIAVGVLLWPALWAAALLVYAFMGDISRHQKGRTHLIEQDATAS
jgi:hypothetical protein